MKKLMLLCCGVLLMSGCAAALIPAAGAGASMLFSNKKPQELPSKTNAKVTSNILFTYDKNEITDWNAENDTVIMDANIIKKFYDVNELLSKVRNAPNSLRLELQEQNWIGVDGQVTERVETVYGDGKPTFKDEKTWAGIFEFSDGINEYLKVNEYEKYVFFGSDFTFDSMSDDDKDLADEYELALSKEESVDELNTLDTSDDTFIEDNDNFDENTCSEDNSTNLENKEEFNRSDFERDDFKVTQKPISTPDEKEEYTFNINENGNSNLKFLKQIKNMVWVYEKEVNSYSEQISLAKYFNLKVYKIKNILQEEVMRKYKKLHISQLKDSLIEEYDTRNIGIKNKKEESFIKLLMPICKKYNVPTNIFSIANLSVTTKLNINNKNVYKVRQKNIKDNIYVCAICTGSNILIDRNYLNLSRFSISNGKLGVSELSLIMFISKTIAHELAHYLYGTVYNTINHYQVEHRLHQEIVLMYSTDRDNVLNLINKYN